MRNKAFKLLGALAAIIISTNVYSINTAAVEPDNIMSNLTNQADQPNPGQVYINEPLDNAIPVIYKYEIGGDGYIVPGEEFTLKFTIYNPAVVSKIGNIKLDLLQSNSLVYPKVGATNSLFIGYLDALSYSQGEITLIASKDITEKEIPLNIIMSYTDNYNTANQQQLVATLPVSSTGKLSLSSVDVPSTMYVGSNNRLSVSFRNNGLSSINDVILNISGDSINDQKISLGSIGSNASMVSDVYVEFIKSGQQIVKISFTYTDSDGQIKKTEPVDYSFDVKNFEAESNDDYAKYMQRRNMINRYMTYAVLLVCVIVLLLGCSLLRKESKNRKTVKGGDK